LGEEALEAIEHNAETILEETGIDFRDDAEALAIWKDAGATIDGERVRFPRGLCRSLIQRSAPAEFVQHARNPARSVRIGGPHSVFAPAYGSPFVRNLDDGRRYATLEDFHNFVKLTYMTPALHHSGGTVCEPVDLPVNKRHLDMLYSHIRHSDKPFMGSVTAPERAEDSVALAKLVFGDDFVAENCVTIGLVNANSPMTWDGTMLGSLKVYAREGQATIIAPFVLAGAMSPVTVAGASAQILAEALAGMAFAQLVRPGAPVIFGAFASSISMQSGAPTFGTPEPQLVLYATAALARRLGVPFRSGGGLCASKIPDAQAAYESANTLQHSMLAGPGAHFLGCAHTRANFETAFYRSSVADNNSFEQWQADGALDATQRANAIWKRMLAEYEAPAIDPGVNEALLDYIARRKAERPDADY
jgi:trimethylamine--corrinoid protein Co-methyltransferase